MGTSAGGGGPTSSDAGKEVYCQVVFNQFKKKKRLIVADEKVELPIQPDTLDTASSSHTPHTPDTKHTDKKPGRPKGSKNKKKV